MRHKPSPRVVVWVAREPATELLRHQILSVKREAPSIGPDESLRLCDVLTTSSEAEVLYGIELLTKSKSREGLVSAEDLAGRILELENDKARVFSRIADRVEPKQLLPVLHLFQHDTDVGQVPDEVFQCRAVEKLHDNEALVAVLANLVNRAVVRVIQCRGSSRFPAEAFQGLRVAR